MPNKASLRIPAKLAFVAFQVAAASAVVSLSCVDESPSPPPDDTADAAIDAKSDGAPADAKDEMMAMDAPSDAQDDGCSIGEYYCIPLVPDASCPGPVCSPDDCSFDAGCTTVA